jgi:capsular exopolysaccharide synthesis family protein
MSKIQSTIQKAIEKSRGTKTSQHAKANRGLRGNSSGTSNSRKGEIFRIFQLAQPRDETMKESRIISAIDDKSAKSAYNVLRTRVLQRMRANNWRTILVTSPTPGDGKSLTATNLAISLSRDVNQFVLLVDLDLQRFSIARYLGMEIEIKKGIGDFLQGNAEIADIVYTPRNIERLAVVANCEPVDNSSDLLGGPRMKELVSWLRQQSDQSIIIFDMPPVLGCDDVLAFCPEVDAILLVVAQGNTDREALDKTMGLLAEKELLGVVLNKSTEQNGNDSYSYY